MNRAANRIIVFLQFLVIISTLAAASATLHAQVKAWGDNTYGNLGTGDTDLRYLPVTLNGLNDIVDISAGASTTLALRRNGTVLSWGKNQYGMLGTGSTTPAQSNVPVQVVNLTGVIAVAAGTRVCMALKSNGTVWVWGNNYWGQFGDGTRSLQLDAFPTPQQVPAIGNVVAISLSSGDHVLALDSQGKVWGWGENTVGEVNFQSGLYVTTPEPVLGFPPGTVFTQISSHVFNSEALTTAGEVYVWGDDQLGQDGLGRCNLTGQVMGLPKRIITSGVTQIATSFYGMAALQANGNVLFWGANSYGQAGNNTSTICTTPVNVTIAGVTDIRAGDQHFLARKTDGTIWGWGYNADSQLGWGTSSFSERIPVQTQAGAGNGRIFDAGGRDGFISNPQAANRPFDLDGDGKTDIGIFRPSGASGAEWWYLRSSTGTSYATQFGAATDKIVAADFTGDGKTDIAFFRPSTGQWFVLRSEDSSFYSFPFGASGDIPVPADFDGDGKADAAVFRPSTATWYISNSGGGTTITQFGLTTDLPVPGDYDGDGKADVAVYRPTGANGAEWWISKSTGGTFVTQFGAPTDKAVPGDYTGDGKTDIAFWRPSTGQWYILRSEDLSFYAFPFGAAGDSPVPGDYDGDGKTDAGVFRASNSTWYINRSTAGVLIQAFGTTGDQPVPGAYVR